MPNEAGDRPTTGAQHCFHSKSTSETDCPDPLTQEVGHPLALALADLALELVDQPQAGLDRPLPRFGQAEPGEQLPAADAKEIGDGAGLAVREQHRVHALLQARAMAYQVQAPTRTLALSAHH